MNERMAAAGEQLYYVVSVHHTHRDDPYILLWRPECKGYCFRTEEAGKYAESEIAAHLGYYHSGCSNIAVKCEVLDVLVVPSSPGYLDTAGQVVPNNKASWADILQAQTWPMAHRARPLYKGARRDPEREAV